MHLPGKTCFLFDFDGTLVDSSPLHDRAFRHALEPYRPDLLLHFDYDQLKGRSTLEAFRSLGVEDDTTLRVLTATKQAEYRRLAKQELRGFPNADGMLTHLHAMNKRLFLVTGGSRTSVHEALAITGWSNLFEAVITADDVAHAKPHPESYTTCIAQNELSPPSCVVVEDAENGLEAARAAQIDAIGVNNSRLAGQTELFFSNLFELGRALGQSLNEKDRL